MKTKGNDAYLWEEMAWYWEGCGEIHKAIRCLMVQAQLQPGKTDAWLNLGAVYGQQKMWGQAVETYLRGLRFDPEDRYIRSNLNQILADKNATDVALEYLDTVAAKHPDPFNLLIAGDLYEMLGMNKEAVARYARGARKAGPDNRAGLRCLTGLVKIFLEAQEYEKARPVVEQTLACWKDDKICLEQAVELYSAEEEVVKLKKYALRLVRKYPSSVAGHQALARCYLAEGDVVRAKEHVTRARKLQGR
jgi:predicted Zn-dependent protease